MLINKDLCSGCGICITECPQKAITKDETGKYVIENQLCNDCADISDIECVRVCSLKAITFNDGTLPEVDPMWRVRPEHLIWMMALIASRGVQDSGKYWVGQPQWDQKRRLTAAAYLDPDIKIRLTRSFDDICQRCPAKQEPGHSEVSGKVDDMCFEKLGVAPGTVMRLWDAVQMIEEKFTIPFMKTLTPIPDDIFSDILRFLSPGSKALHDT